MKISSIFVAFLENINFTVSPLSMISIIHSLFLQEPKDLGMGFEFRPQKLEI